MGSLVFLNNDIEVIAPDWLEEMTSQALRPEIGAVGTMLCYPDDTIQHAGVILGIDGIAGHVYHKDNKNFIGQRGRGRLAQNYSAITGACMAIKKKLFHEIDGFNEEDLPISNNDIYLCIRLIKEGCWNLWTPHAKLNHYESSSRGHEDTLEKQARYQSEKEYMQKGMVR